MQGIFVCSFECDEGRKAGWDGLLSVNYVVVLVLDLRRWVGVDGVL